VIEIEIERGIDKVWGGGEKGREEISSCAKWFVERKSLFVNVDETSRRRTAVGCSEAKVAYKRKKP